MRKALVFGILLSLLLLIFALQNADPVDIDLYFWNLESSLAIALLVTFLAGILAGYLFAVPTILKKSFELREAKDKAEQVESTSEDTAKSLTKKDD